MRSEDEARQLADQFLQTIKGKTGILIERGKRRYGFLHMTFEEYFAAWDLVIRKKDRDDFIKQHLHEPRWRVVILLIVGIIGILHSDENGVTELVEEVIFKAKSPYEKWLHRDLLLAGLCLADDIGISTISEDTIIEHIIYTYLTSPYSSLRTQFLHVFNVWRGTSMKAKVIDFVLSTINQMEQILRTTHSLSTIPPSSNTYPFESKLNVYYQQLAQQNQKSFVRIVYLGLIIALHDHINMTDRFQVILEAISDADSDVRQTAATVLGQIGNNQPEVIEALLKLLSDSNSVCTTGSSHSPRTDRQQPTRSDRGSAQELLSDSNWSVQQTAATALGQTGNNQPEVIEALLKTLTSAFSLTQQAAATALGQTGNNQPEVIEALLKLLSDSNSSVQ